MAEEFGFGLEESWKAVRDVLAYVRGSEPHPDAMEYLRRGWWRGKARLLEHLGPTGRVVVAVRDRELRHGGGCDEEPEGGGEGFSVPLDSSVIPFLERGQWPTPSEWAAAKLLVWVLGHAEAKLTVGELLANKTNRKCPDPQRPGKYLPTGTKLTTLVTAVVRALPEPEVAWLWGQLVDITYSTANALLPPNEWDNPDKCRARIIGLLVTFIGNVKQMYGVDDQHFLVLSVNPLDILLASEAAAYSSCIRLRGQYATATLAYMTSPGVAIAYAYKDYRSYSPARLKLPHKVWRQWVYFDLERGGALHQREYPAERHPLARVARQLAASVLWAECCPPGTPYAWKVTFNPSYDSRWVENTHWVYLDATWARIRLACYPKQTLHVALAGAVPCLDCGKLRYDGDPEDLLCEDCSDSGPRCYACGCRVDPDDEYVGSDGEAYCEDCFYERFGYCSNCGDARRHEDLCTGPDGDSYCEDCFDRYFVYCTSCDEPVDRERALTGLDNEPYCERCFRETFDYCADCGELVWQDELRDGLCEDCARAREEVDNEEHAVV